MSIGILTFHCADNYGAMLQAYGLKYFVKKVFLPCMSSGRML